MTTARSMEISVMYPAAGERPHRHTMGGLSACASFGIAKGGGGGGRERVTRPWESYSLTVITIESPVLCHLEISITMNLG